MRSLDSSPQDKEVQGVQKLVPYKIVDSQDGAAWVEVQGNKMSPSQVSLFTSVQGGHRGGGWSLCWS